MKVGLRIDVDTLRGTREGVPRLLALLAHQEVYATFFFSVGPDNMGRHLWRLLKPAFLWKMLRSQALSLYGWQMLLAGTAWPGRRIGNACADIFRQTDAAGHEIGLHAWDHYRWQMQVARWSSSYLTAQFKQGMDALNQILGQTVSCSAVPGWRADQRVIEMQQGFPLQYHSDCRGTTPFYPRLATGDYGRLQLPVSLPTFDEVIGRLTTVKSYNDFIIQKIQQQPQYAVYTIHAEVEGIGQAEAFERLLLVAKQQGIQFCPLEQLIPEATTMARGGILRQGSCSGREGWVACQGKEDAF